MSNVNSPKHYFRGDIECIEAIRESMSKEAYLGYCKGNIIKYIWRYDLKNGIEDLRKAKVYLELMIDELEEDKQEETIPKMFYDILINQKLSYMNDK